MWFDTTLFVVSSEGLSEWWLAANLTADGFKICWFIGINGGFIFFTVNVNFKN